MQEQEHEHIHRRELHFAHGANLALEVYGSYQAPWTALALQGKPRIGLKM